MRGGAALVVLLVACGGTAAPTTTDGRAGAALEYAISADRALSGTRFEALGASATADLILGLCAGEGSVMADVSAVVAGVAAPAGAAGDDAILFEVLLTGVTTVCPERTAADLSAAYLAAVGATVAESGGLVLDDATALGVGLAVCQAFDAGTAADGLVTVAAGAFGIEATAAELLGGAMDQHQAITAGAVLAAAANYLCPEHAPRVAEFIADLVESTVSRES